MGLNGKIHAGWWCFATHLKNIFVKWDHEIPKKPEKKGSKPTVRSMVSGRDLEPKTTTPSRSKKTWPEPRTSPPRWSLRHGPCTGVEGAEKPHENGDLMGFHGASPSGNLLHSY